MCAWMDGWEKKGKQKGEEEQQEGLIEEGINGISGCSIGRTKKTLAGRRKA